MRLTRLTLLLLAISLLLTGCGDDSQQSLVEKIRAQGELLVATREDATTYYSGGEGTTGLEYDLVTRFAERLGVKARFVTPERFEDILTMVQNGEVHIAAAGLTVTKRRQKQVAFGPGYKTIVQEVVYKSGQRRPRKMQDLMNGTLEVVKGSSHEALLRDRRRREAPKLPIGTHTDVDSQTLLSRVAEGLIDYTVADSSQLALARRHHPELRVGFTLSEPQQLAWALQKDKDQSLLLEVNAFFEEFRKSGELDQLLERYFGYAERFSPVEVATFRKMIPLRLSMYRHWFVQAGEQTGFDWRLLAAVGYQESHWNPAAVSPTGVRGIMMLTRATAKQMQVKNREDPRESILGGARYLKRVLGKIPSRVEEPDRTWLALAAYNVGYGHLEDARVLCQNAGDNPDRWVDVKRYLPRLSEKKWYKKTRYGYARGEEPVRYVDAVRGYVDLMEHHFPDDEDASENTVTLPFPASL